VCAAFVAAGAVDLLCGVDYAFGRVPRQTAHALARELLRIVLADAADSGSSEGENP
jgi:hypothetical protein